MKAKQFNAALALDAINDEFAKSEFIPPVQVSATQVVIRKPYCFVSLISLEHSSKSDRRLIGAGFSKCNPSDKWSKNLGLAVAFRRAVRDYVEQAKAAWSPS